MDRNEAMKLLSEIKLYLTAGNPVWDVDEIAEACDMAIEALRNEINCVKCVHYTERETYTGIKGVCKMDTAHREDLIRRQLAIDVWDELSEHGRTEFDQVLMTLPSAEPKTKCIAQIRVDRDENGKGNRDAIIIYNFLKKKIGSKIIDNPFEFEDWYNRMIWHVQECYRLQKHIDRKNEIIHKAKVKLKMGCTGCAHYDQQQTALICRDCKRSYSDMYEEW